MFEKSPKEDLDFSKNKFFFSIVGIYLFLLILTFCNWMCQLGFISIIIYTFNYTLSNIEVWIMYNVHQKILPFFFDIKQTARKVIKILQYHYTFRRTHMQRDTSIQYLTWKSHHTQLSFFNLIWLTWEKYWRHHTVANLQQQTKREK